MPSNMKAGGDLYTAEVEHIYASMVTLWTVWTAYPRSIEWSYGQCNDVHTCFGIKQCQLHINVHITCIS